MVLTVSQQWRPIDPQIRSKNLAKAKAQVEAIKLVSKSQLHCLKCGDRGHLTQVCRNVTVCFVCEKLGYKSFQCRSAASPPFPDRASINSDRVTPPDRVFCISVRAPPSSDRVPSHTDLVKNHSDMAYLPPMTRFGYSEASQRLEASFENNID
jgi:hypothetical protein